MNLTGYFRIRRLTWASVTSGALVTTGGLAVSSALNLAGLLLWVRLLTPAEFGTLSLVSAAGLMLNALGFEWLRLAGARSLSDPTRSEGVSPERLSAWIRVAGIAALIVTLTVLLFTLAGIAAPSLAPRWNAAILLLGVSEMLLAAITLVARLRLQSSTYAGIMIGRSALALSGGVALVFSGAGAAGIVAATAIAQVAITALAIARDPLWRSAIGAPSNRQDRSDLVCLGLPLIAGSALALAAGTIDRGLISAHLGLAAAGHFAAPAELVAKTLGFALMAVNLSAYPLLVRTHERAGPAAASRALERNLAVLLAVALPILLTICLLARPLAAALLGPASLPLAPRLLPWLAGAALLRLLVTFHFGIAIQLARRMSLLLVPPLITLAILIPGAAPVIASGGLEGFTILLFAAQGGGTVAAWFLARRVLPTRLVTPATLRLLAASALLALLLAPLRPA